MPLSKESTKKPTKTKLGFKYDLVAIIWDDAHGSSSWEEINDDPLEPCLILTIGFVIKEDEHRIKVADSYFIDGKEYSGTTQIPKGMIKDITILKKKKATK